MRKSTQYVVFLAFLDAAAVVFEASGAAEDMGILPRPGAGDHLTNAINALDGIQPGSGAGSTLFALYIGVTETAQGMIKGIFAGPIMLDNLGVPTFLVVFLFAPATLLAGADIIYMATGRDL